MPPKDQAMIDPFRLVIIQSRQFSERWRCGFVQKCFRHRLESGPACEVEHRRVRNLPQHTAPFDDHPINVSRAEQFSNPRALAERIFVNRCDDLLRARTVAWWDAVFEITWDALDSVNLMTRHGYAARP